MRPVNEISRMCSHNSEKAPTRAIAIAIRHFHQGEGVGAISEYNIVKTSLTSLTATSRVAHRSQPTTVRSGARKRGSYNLWIWGNEKNKLTLLEKTKTGLGVTCHDKEIKWI